MTRVRVIPTNLYENRQCLTADIDQDGADAVSPQCVESLHNPRSRGLRLLFSDCGSVAFCTGQPPVFNGVEQDTFSPSGNLSIVVHNADVPVLVFDVSSVATEEEFLEACGSGDLQPLAQGTVKQRPIINFTEDAANIKVKSRGVVTDVTGQDWTLQSFLKVHGVFATPETEVLVEWVTLTAK